jgi:hypothetical protein
MLQKGCHDHANIHSLRSSTHYIRPSSACRSSSLWPRWLAWPTLHRFLSQRVLLGGARLRNSRCSPRPRSASAPSPTTPLPVSVLTPWDVTCMLGNAFLAAYAPAPRGCMIVPRVRGGAERGGCPCTSSCISCQSSTRALPHHLWQPDCSVGCVDCMCWLSG